MATRTPKQQAEQDLMDALMKAFDGSDRILDEAEALECALAVAEGWKMRLAELQDEDE